MLSNNLHSVGDLILDRIGDLIKLQASQHSRPGHAGSNLNHPERRDADDCGFHSDFFQNQRGSNPYSLRPMSLAEMRTEMRGARSELARRRLLPYTLRAIDAVVAFLLITEGGRVVISFPPLGNIQVMDRAESL
jgi:hypothetical protein